MAEKLHKVDSMLILGRGLNWATADEGALIIKNITGIQAESHTLGELKHGSLAMIDEDSTIIMIMVKDHVYQKCKNGLEQIMARKGRPIMICTEGDEEVSKLGLQSLPIPRCDSPYLQSILAIIPLQLLAYYMAVQSGKDVDVPRPWMAETAISSVEEIEK